MADARPSIEATIFSLLADRKPSASICPSEVARAMAPADGWRELMPEIREVAGSLADAGHLRVTRGGIDVDATAPGGPIRLARPQED